MKINFFAVALIAVLLIALFIFYKGCNKIDALQNDINNGIRKSDSIANLAKVTFHANDSVKTKITEDSIFYNQKIDSLEMAFKKISTGFNATKLKLQDLAERYRQALNNIDTGSAIQICDSLINDLAVAKDQLQQVETNRDSLIAYHEQTIKGLYEDIAVLQKEIEELKGDLLVEMELLKSCQNDFAKLNRGKKANAIIAKVEFVLLVALGIFTSLKK